MQCSREIISPLKPKIICPTEKEFEDVSGLIQKILEDKESQEKGIVKVIPPRGLKRKTLHNEMEIPTPRTQRIRPISSGIYEIEFIPHKKMKYEAFRDKSIRFAAESKIKTDLMDISDQYTEDIIWKTLQCSGTKSNSVYGLDSEESLFANDEPWNMNNFSRNHSIINVANYEKIPGIHTSYVNVGMMGTWFGVHKEDCDLASMNVLHYGAPKTWYAVPAEDAKKLHQVFNAMTVQENYECPNVLQHKCFILHPSILQKNGIKFSKVTQYSNEIIFTLYGAPHFGFNHDLNVCESSNLASPKYFKIYENAQTCPDDCEYALQQCSKITKNKIGKILQESSSVLTEPSSIGDIISIAKENSSTPKQESSKLKMNSESESKLENRDTYSDVMDLEICTEQLSFPNPLSVVANSTMRCNFCGKIFKSVGNKNKHDKEYHAQVVLRYSCNFCELSNSPNPYIVLNHHKIKHQDKPLPEVKDIAVNEVPNPMQAQIEWKIQKEKPPTRVYHREPVSCHLCNKTYMGKYSLAKHIKLNHKEDNTDNPRNCEELIKLEIDFVE